MLDQTALDALARLCVDQTAIRLVVIFGSVAKGTARPDSDVDVAMSGGGFYDQLTLGAEMDTTLGREVHVVDLADAPAWLRFNVARDGVLVHQATPDEWALFKARAMLDFWDLAPTIALCAAGVRARLEREAVRD